MRFLRQLCIVLCLLSVTFAANAYDVDTHFYEMYMLARFAGINHEVAAELAGFDEWIDQSQWTSAMFPIPYIGERMRRLYHFPMGSETYNDDSNDPLDTHGARFNLLGVVQENDPFARQMLTEGIRKRDLMFIGAGLHTHMDSFGHSKWSYVTGHIEGSHWPDRPWADLEKHDRMTLSLFQDLVALRSVLPDSALDKSFTVGGDAPNYRLSAEELQKRYLKVDVVRQALENDPFTDPRYTLPAITYILEKAQKNGILKGNVQQIISQNQSLFTKGRSTRDILTVILQDLLTNQKDENQFVDFKAAQREILYDIPIDRVPIQELGVDKVIQTIVQRLTAGLIPTPPVHASFEHEGPLRNLEMRIRLDDWRKTIFAVTGKKIRFDAQTVMSKVKAYIQHRHNKIVEDLSDFELVTLSKQDRLKWIAHMAHYGFLSGFRSKASSENLLIEHPDQFHDLIAQWAQEAGIETDQFKVLTEQQLAVIKARRQKAQQQAQLASQVEASSRGEVVPQQIDDPAIDPCLESFKVISVN